MRPFYVTLGERRPKDRGERHRSEVVLGGLRGHAPPRIFLNLESLKCHFVDFGGRFDRNQRVRKRHYNVSKLAIWSIRRPLFLFAPLRNCTPLLQRSAHVTVKPVFHFANKCIFLLIRRRRIFPAIPVVAIPNAQLLFTFLRTARKN